jgi:uncharacterized protein (DUF58 family)
VTAVPRAARPSALRRALVGTPFLDFVRRVYRENLTARGRYLLWTTGILAVLGVDTRRSQVFVLFAVAASGLLLAVLFALRPRPRARLECALPFRTTAGAPVVVRARVLSPGGRPRELRLGFPRPADREPGVAIDPFELFLPAGPEPSAEVAVRLQASRRGRFVLSGPRLGVTDPLGLLAGPGTPRSPHVLLAHPPFFTLDTFSVPLGRRHQPGGIPLSSSTGEAIEFVGTRDYRDGDPVRTIHWRSWARRGRPVVKEFQEEYFCRIALVLDTFLPRRHRAPDRRGFEAAICVLASIADFFSRTDDIVDILAAGPDIYEVSAGRSLAYLENILDLLACLGPCHDPPFATIGPTLFARLAQITTVVAVVLDWDEPRAAFLRQVKSLGTAVRVVVVREKETTKPWAPVVAELGDVSVMTPADVERLLARERPAAGRSPSNA